MTAWAPVATGDGSWTLRHGGHGQTCHSVAGAWQEARERYALPCRLRELALERSARGEPGPVALLDIGTGLALNLAAAWAALRGTGVALHAVTLEADPTVLAAALDLVECDPTRAPWVLPLRATLDVLARAGGGVRGLEGPEGAVPLRLELLLGDARQRVAELARSATFDAVFLDPFSPRVAPELWGADFLQELAARMRPDALLSTYSSSLAVRRALAAAGLAVGAGGRVGSKASGTLASLAARLPPLPERAARRLGRRARSQGGEGGTGGAGRSPSRDDERGRGGAFSAPGGEAGAPVA